MILDVITAATATLPGPPEVSFRGPIDLLVTTGLRDDVEVLDDGKGLVEGTTLSGLANLCDRAETWGGTFEIASRPGPGTRLHWTARLAPPGGEDR